MRIGKIFEFDAAHHLEGHHGKCKNIHGHTYKLEVEVEAEPFPTINIVMDFESVKKRVEVLVLNKLDHSDLNESLKEGNPTAEAIVKWIVKRLKASQAFPSQGNEDYNNPRVKVCRVRLWETSTSYAEWRKEDD